MDASDRPLPGAFQSAADALSTRDIHGLIAEALVGIKYNRAFAALVYGLRPKTGDRMIARHVVNFAEVFAKLC